MLSRSKLKIREGELVETNPKIGRVYPKRKMTEEIPLESDSQFMDSFMTMRDMVEEIYREFNKDRSEDSSTSKQNKGIEEFLIDGHFEGKGKGKEAPLSTPPDSPENKKKKTSLIKLDVKFDLPIYDGELNAEKLDNWIRQIDVYCWVQNIDSNMSKIQLANLHLGGTALGWWEGRTQSNLKKHGKILSAWSHSFLPLKNNSIH